MQDTCSRFFVPLLLSLVFSELQGHIQYGYGVREGWIRPLASLYPVTHKFIHRGVRKGRRGSRAHCCCRAREVLRGRQADCPGASRKLHPEQQFLLPLSRVRISAEGSLPLSGITPSGRLKLSFQRTDYKPFTPGGSAGVGAAT